MEPVWVTIAHCIVVRPPTYVYAALPGNLIVQKTLSVHKLLELLHRQRAHGLRRWLRLEDAWLLSERIDALAGWPGWLLLQLHVEGAGKFELTSLLELSGCKSDHSLSDLLDLARLQAGLLGDGGVRASSRQLTSALLGRSLLHGSWG